MFGRYRLISRLGTGGMAEVWKVANTGPGGFTRYLVLKRILPHLARDPPFLQMFATEARLSARLFHANIVQVFEFDEWRGEHFMTMEFIRGCDLHALLRSVGGRPPPPGLGAFVVGEICRALGYAHALTDSDNQPLRLVHRDVSPSNVMIGSEGAVKLMDFGIAKALGDRNSPTTSAGTFKGKLSYTAPEILDGLESDARSDLFCAGVVLYETLTGQRLFAGRSEGEVVVKVRACQVELPSRLNPAVPEALDRICLKALARDPDARYASGEVMAAELGEIAHELRFDSAQLSATLKELLPEQPWLGESQEPAPSSIPVPLTPNARTLTNRAPPEARRRWPATAAAAAAFCAAGIALALWSPWSAPPHPPAPPASSAVVAVSPVAPAAAPAEPPPPSRMAWLDSEPLGQVTVVGEQNPRGATPIELEVSPGSEALSVQVTAPGHRTETVQLRPGVRSFVHLAPAGVLRPTRPSRPVGRRPGSGAVDLLDGGLTNPFLEPH
jgi:serine/threonine-protein kinase